ncbi:MAG TPA: carboxypeptidase-like regulatory domain-containing protein [Bryobacteraceae bacterium]|jgi:hypothetical protein|nr:carboxypeptidase-like regulatory domain-containing protein [Bryobacteraceae bacterium]
MKNTYLVVMCLLLGSVAAAQTGAVSGTITDQAGNALAGVTVSYSRLPGFLPRTGSGPPRLSPGESYASASATTDTLGRQAVQGLPVGNYLVCVAAEDQPILDPCKWSTPPPLEVTRQSTASLDFAVQRGVFLRVRANDPKGLLPASQPSPMSPAHLIVGIIFGTGASLAAQRVSVDTGGQDYRIAIPTGMPLQLWLVSGFVTLADQNGAPLQNVGTKIPLQAVPGVDQLFTINVTGKLITAVQ